jgi:LacI family transcriptional regulator
VGFRNREAIVRAVRYLLDLGHRRIGMLAGVTAHNDRAAERVAGVREALAAAGLQTAAALADRGALHRAGGARSDPACAARCRTDRAALRQRRAGLRRTAGMPAAGVDVPRAMSVIGFDDLDMARQWRPALTTVHVPTEQMWTLAAEYLLDRLDGSLREAVQREVEVELVLRESSAPPLRRGAGR